MAVIPSQLPVVDKADGTVGVAIPSVATQVAGTDGTNLRALKVDTSGGLIVTVGSTVSTKTDLTPSSPTSTSVGVASAQAVASNANRKGLILTNVSNNKISIGIGAAAVLNSGITLYPGGSFTMSEYSFDTSAINAIASVASSTLGIQEFTT